MGEWRVFVCCLNLVLVCAHLAVCARVCARPSACHHLYLATSIAACACLSLCLHTLHLIQCLCSCVFMCVDVLYIFMCVCVWNDWPSSTSSLAGMTVGGFEINVSWCGLFDPTQPDQTSIFHIGRQHQEGSPLSRWVKPKQDRQLFYMCTLTSGILRHIQWVRKCSVEECFCTEVEWMEWKMVHCQRFWIFMVNMYCVLSIPWWIFNMPPGPFTHAESWQKEKEEENGERERECVNFRCFRTREKTFYLLKKGKGRKRRVGVGVQYLLVLSLAS